MCFCVSVLICCCYYFNFSALCCCLNICIIIIVIIICFSLCKALDFVSVKVLFCLIFLSESQCNYFLIYEPNAGRYLLQNIFIVAILKEMYLYWKRQFLFVDSLQVLAVTDVGVTNNLLYCLQSSLQSGEESLRWRAVSWSNKSSFESQKEWGWWYLKYSCHS